MRSVRTSTVIQTPTGKVLQDFLTLFPRGRLACVHHHTPSLPATRCRLKLQMVPKRCTHYNTMVACQSGAHHCHLWHEANGATVNTYTGFANSPGAIADVCVSLVNSNVFISYAERVYISFWDTFIHCFSSTSL